MASPTAKPGTPAEEMYITTLTTAGSMEETDEHIVVYTENELTGWRLYGNLIKEEAVKAAQSSFLTYIVVLLICIVFGGLLVYLITRSIMQPIRQLIDAAIQISDGNLSNPVIMTTTNEIGQLGQTFENRRSNEFTCT